MKSAHLQGLGVAMVTPMHADGSIDLNATESLVNHLLQGGVDFLIPLGTTGETPTLGLEEQQQYVRHVVKVAAGRVPIVVGASGNNTAQLVQHLRSMDCEGVDYILSAVPSYNKPSQSGIVEHYREVAAASPRPVILYNVPGRTGVNMLADTTCRIAHEIPNVVGVKEASGNLDQVAAILRNRPQGFIVLSGDDSLTLPMMALGAEGVISVIGNVVPRLFGELVHAASRNDTQAAAQIHLRLVPLFGQLFEEGNPSGAKSALSLLKVCENRLRLPLVPVSTSLQRRIEASLKELGEL